MYASTSLKNCLLIIKNQRPGMVVYIYNSSTWEAEAGGASVYGQPWLHSKTQSQKTKQTRTLTTRKRNRDFNAPPRK
jgi:hypothetical protein